MYSDTKYDLITLCFVTREIFYWIIFYSSTLFLFYAILLYYSVVHFQYPLVPELRLMVVC